MASSLPRECFSGLDEVAGHAVNAVQTAEEIIKLNLIHLPPEFPDVELGSRIKVVQRGIKNQAVRYHGEVRGQLYHVVRSIHDFAKKNNKLSDKILRDIDVESAVGQKQVMGVLKLLIGDISRLISRFDAIQRNLEDVRHQLLRELKDLEVCIAKYNEHMQRLEDERKERDRLRCELRKVEADRREITHGVIKVLGIVVLVGLGGGVGVGLCMYGGIAGVALNVGWSGITCTLKYGAAVTGLKCIAAAGTGVGCVAAAVETACLAPAGFEYWKKYERLCNAKHEIEAKLGVTPGGMMECIRDKLEKLNNLGDGLHTQLGKVKGDWQILHDSMQETLEKLQKGEDPDMFFLIKDQIEDAQSSWDEALRWAKALYEVPQSSDSPDEPSCMGNKMLWMMGDGST